MLSLILFKKLILVILSKFERLNPVFICVIQLFARYDGACDFSKFKSVALIALFKFEYSPSTFCNWNLTVMVTCPCGDKVSTLFGASMNILLSFMKFWFTVTSTSKADSFVIVNVKTISFTS